jgi:uncharacterized protein (UPF0333 family)
MMNSISLIDKSQIVVPRGKLDTSFFIIFSIILLIIVIGVYFEIKMEKKARIKQEQDFEEYKKAIFNKLNR